MAAVTTPPITLQGRFAAELPELTVPWRPATLPDPQLVVLNESLAAELDLDPARLSAPDGVAILAGAAAAAGSTPVAQAYAGHQFGFYSPRLGDGRAALLGELALADGRLSDLHLKGSGATPFARAGDGKAALGPMLRECLIGEAMHGLGIATSRALAVTTTGETVARETMLPGAVLARVAASHIRVGTFQYAAALGDPALVARLADHAIARHHPTAAEAGNRFLALLEQVVAAQASLIAQWMHVGFVHGVMNTDNMAISGETIDYGPCAFIDAFDPATVYSSIDEGGRYAYGNQPDVALWNLSRFAESLLGVIDEHQETAIALATERLRAFGELYGRAWRTGMRTKLGFGPDPDPGADVLAGELLELLRDAGADYTASLRALSSAARGDAAPFEARVGGDREAARAWLHRWRTALPVPAEAAAEAMDAANPVYIPRNHLVEAALAAATQGELEPTGELLSVLAAPFSPRPGLERYAEPAPEEFAAGFRTFCGT